MAAADTKTTAWNGSDYLAAARSSGDESGTAPSASTAPSTLSLAPRNQSVAAVAEEEWEKQGIGFRSRAEAGTGAWEGLGGGGKKIGSGEGISAVGGGAALIADLIQQSLIHDQYDRAVQEQDDMVEKRAERIKEKIQRGKSSTV